MQHSDLAELCQRSYDELTYVINECELLLTHVDGVQIVTFRGTEAGSLFKDRGWIDVIRDMRITPWYDKDTGWAHAGFLKGGRKAAGLLKKILTPDVPVILTGHSLGGALALMCAVKLQAEGFYIKEWVGFGSPKCQFTDKRYHFVKTNYRHGADVVPLMARWTPYRHNFELRNINPEPGKKATWDDHDINFYVQYFKQHQDV